MAKIATEHTRTTTSERKPREPKEAGLKTRKDLLKPAEGRKIKVLYAAPEAQPFAGTGGLGFC